MVGVKLPTFTFTGLFACFMVFVRSPVRKFFCRHIHALLSTFLNIWTARCRWKRKWIDFAQNGHLLAFHLVGRLSKGTKRDAKGQEETPGCSESCGQWSSFAVLPGRGDFLFEFSGRRTSVEVG